MQFNDLMHKMEVQRLTGWWGRQGSKPEKAVWTDKLIQVWAGKNQKSNKQVGNRSSGTTDEQNTDTEAREQDMKHIAMEVDWYK